MAFGDRGGWAAKLGDRIPPPTRTSIPPTDKTSTPELDVYIEVIPEPVVPAVVVPEPPVEEPEEVVALEPDAKRIRYHYNKNKLSAGLFVMRIGGELDEAAVKRVVEFIEAELNAVPY